MPAMLMYPGNRGWPAFQALLRGLLRFLEPYLRNAQLTEAIRLLYKVSALPMV
jgi:CCR4-NOT transcription complex subunit 1